MSIAGDLIRGHTDAIILARLLRGDSYGYEINKKINEIINYKETLKREKSIKNKILNELLYLGYDISHKGT